MKELILKLHRGLITLEQFNKAVLRLKHGRVTDNIKIYGAK